MAVLVREVPAVLVDPVVLTWVAVLAWADPVAAWAAWEEAAAFPGWAAADRVGSADAAAVVAQAVLAAVAAETAEDALGALGAMFPRSAIALIVDAVSGAGC